jgi:hypothetical protein
VHDPVFFSRQVFVKLALGENSVPSGTLTSETNLAWLQGISVAVIVGLAVGLAVGALVLAGMGGSVDVAVSKMTSVGLEMGVSVGADVDGSTVGIIAGAWNSLQARNARISMPITRNGLLCDI